MLAAAIWTSDRRYGGSQRIVVRSSKGADYVTVAQDQSNTQTEATWQADERNRKIKEEDKAKDWRDQPQPKKKDKRDT